jgi:hypothetical protein
MFSESLGGEIARTPQSSNEQEAEIYSPLFDIAP